LGRDGDIALSIGEGGSGSASLVCDGHRVRAIISQDPGPLPQALEAHFESESMEGTVTSIFLPQRLLLIDGNAVRVDSKAVVLIHEEATDEQALESFDSIGIGDGIECFGLPTCGDPVVDLDAFTTVINRE